MSKDCEQLRQLLVELAYDELDAMEFNALQAHLDECGSCATHLAAYRAVRADLKTWDEVEPGPSRITFVAMHHKQPTVRWSRGRRTGAIAASFLLGLLLTAAAANFQLSRDDSGWSASTSLWPSDAQSVPATAASPEAARTVGPTVPVGSGSMPAGSQRNATGMVSIREADLTRWLDDQLQTRGLHTVGGVSTSLSPEQLQTLQRIVAASEQRQRESFDSLLAGTYQAFDVQRTEDLLFLAGELGSMQESTGLELQRTNAALDYLITRAADDPRQREQRDDDD